MYFVHLKHYPEMGFIRHPETVTGAQSPEDNENLYSFIMVTVRIQYCIRKLGLLRQSTIDRGGLHDRHSFS